MLRLKKGAFLAALTGTLLASGCLGLGWKQLILDTAIYAGQEFLFDGGLEILNGEASG